MEPNFYRLNIGTCMTSRFCSEYKLNKYYKVSHKVASMHIERANFGLNII